MNKIFKQLSKHYMNQNITNPTEQFASMNEEN